MSYDPNFHHRRSIRLQGYDYSQAGAYFVTLCVQRRECLLGEIVEQQMQLNQYGEIVLGWWNNVPDHFSGVDLDAFVVMPNHIHGVLVLSQESPQPPKLGQIVAYFKYESTKRVNVFRSTPGLRLWQRNYYEHIIRNESSLQEIRDYIATNPMRWIEDQLHPERPSKW